MQNGVLRARRSAVGDNKVDKMILKVEGRALIPADTPFLLTSRSTVIVHAAQKDVKAGSRPSLAVRKLSKHINIETPEFTRVNTPCVGAQSSRLHDTFDSDDVYTKRHFPYERAEKRCQRWDNEALRADLCALNNRIQHLEALDGSKYLDALGTSSQGEHLKAEMLLKARFLRQRYQGLLCLEELKKPTKRRRRSSSPRGVQSESSPSGDASLPPHLLAHQSSPPQEVDIVEPYLGVQVYCGIPLGVVPTSDSSSAAGVVEDVEADEVAPVVLGRGKRKKIKNSRYDGSLWEGH
ncbi:hypothetical protein B0H14DRAFT_3854897 [Mycena olivaceomarginata]|nr:hypothetical protein B0H14DRAFT_3854897 [Mycena olivaceomarginata]